MSKCQLCQKNESRVDITLQLDPENVNILLCSECAENYRLNMQGLEKDSLEPFIRRALALSLPAENEDGDSAIRSCPNCGITADEVEETEKVGCPFCYFVFNHLPDLQGHGGRGGSFLPEYTYDGEESFQESLEVLQRRLDEAIANERFEVAAELRDQINSRL